MTTDPLYLGVDVGTTAVKAALFNSAGALQAVETISTHTDMHVPGWSEQSMDAVWQNTVKTIHDACKKIATGRVASIGVCGQGDGLWMLDAHRQPVRPAILWNDQRANDQVTRWIEDGTSDVASRFCRTAIWAGTSAAAFTWVKDNEPEQANSVEYAMHCKDWINFNLTGNITTDYSDASIPFLDFENRTYAPETFDMLGVKELIGKFPVPAFATSQNGFLLEDVAAAIGVDTGTSVATGCIDVAAMVVGMDLRQTGDMCLILGTTAVLAVLIDPEEFLQPPVGATLVHPFLDKWIRVMAPLSGALALDWFNALETNEADTEGNNFAARNALIAKVPAGANGLVFLPFLGGERAPFVAPDATASFLGITQSTTNSDMARAIMEGAAMSLRHCFDSTGVEKPKRLFITGGGARNRLWCDIIASVMDTAIVASDASDHGLWGAAKIGAAAAGLIDLEAFPPRKEEVRIHAPNPDDVATYKRLYALYRHHIDTSEPQWDARQLFLRGE